MKRIISVMVIIAILFSVLGACKEKIESETTTIPTSTTAETTQEEITTEHVTTSKPETSTAKVKTETIRVKNEEHSFTFEKTDFEKNYSEETLMKISSLIPLEYGCEDYNNWHGSPEEVINDAISCSFDSRKATFFERFSPGSPEDETARNEIAGYKYKVYDDYVITNVGFINSFLSERFGPDARQFKPEDFDTYEEAVTHNGSVTEGIGTPGYRYIYLPESELIMCYMSEVTGWGGVTALYVYDIQTVDGDYVVKAVYGRSEYTEYAENSDTFAGLQSGALKMLEGGTDDVPHDCTMVIGETGNGDVYMKNVTKNQISFEK